MNEYTSGNCQNKRCLHFHSQIEKKIPTVHHNCLDDPRILGHHCKVCWSPKNHRHNHHYADQNLDNAEKERKE